MASLVRLNDAVDPKTVPATCARCGSKLAAGTSSCPACDASLPDSETPTVAPTIPAPPQSPSPDELVTLTTAPAGPEKQAVLPERFKLGRLLGTGGMGAVYLARDTLLEREVAIKFIRTAHPALIDRLKLEARAIAGIEHPNVVRLYDLVFQDQPLLVMEYVRGKTLAVRLATGRPTQLEAVQILRGVIEGIGAAHARGIVHRDLKPSNIFFDERNQPKVADFGLARTLDPRDGDTTISGQILGTPGYMAPEQCRALEAKPSADIYAIGLIFHEMLTGRRVYTGSSTEEILLAQRTLPPPPASHINPSVPAALDDLLARMLAQDGQARPDAASVLSSLDTWLENRRRTRKPSGSLPPHPYKRLEHFGVADAPIYFGRDSEVAELVELIENAEIRLLQVFGPCGIGKSSLLRAGLVPALDPARHHPLVLLSGANPASALSGALIAHAKGLGIPVQDRLVETLSEDPRGLANVLLQIERRGGRKLVLIIDQLEELFTLSPADSENITNFFRMVEVLAEAQSIRLTVVASYRTEFRGDFFPLEERLGHRQKPYNLREIQQGNLEEAILGPASLEEYDFRYDEAFPAQLAGDILQSTRQSGEASLAVMQIVCYQLYERRTVTPGAMIGRELYERSLGGTRGALQRYVEERLTLAPYAQYGDLARQMLAALTLKEEGGERFARALEEDELLAFPNREAARLILDRLATDHLVTRNVAADGRRQVRLASEVICPLVDDWLLGSGEAETASRVLGQGARNWKERGEDTADLLPEARLALVERHLETMRGLTEVEAAYLNASRNAAAAGRRRRRIAATAICLISVYLIYFVKFRPGTLQLATEAADTTVKEGNRVLGKASRTPLVLAMSPGVHHLQLEKDPYRPTTVTVEIPPGGVTDLSRNPVLMPYPFGTVNITSDPTGATFEIRRPGKAPSVVCTGVTPLVPEVPSGDYELALSRPGFVPRVIRHLKVLENRRLTPIHAHLDKDFGTLMVASTFLETKLVVAGLPDRKVCWQGSLPTREPIELAPGDYELNLTNLTSSRTRTVHIDRGARTALTVWMPPVRQIWFRPEPGLQHALMALADLDGDGRLDVISVGSDDRVTARSGSGGAILWQYPMKYGGNPIVADVDPDGVTDIIVADGDGAVHAISGKSGRGLWKTPIGSPVVGSIACGGTGPAGVVACLGRDRQVRVLSLATGAPLWQAPVGGAAARSPQVADLDGDGVPDILFGLTEIAGGGACTALSGKTHTALWTHRMPGPVEVGPVIGQAGPDGAPTVVVTGGKGVVRRLSGRTGQALWTATLGQPITAAPLLADLHGDGNPEIIVCTDRPQLVSISTKGDVLWSVSLKDPIIAPPMAADLDRDGTPDIALADRLGRFLAISGRTQEMLFEIISDSRTGSVILGDVNGDGVPEMVAASEWIAAYENLMPEPRWAWTSLAMNDQSITSTPAVADLDGDGVPDVVSLWPQGELAAVSGARGNLLWSHALPRTPERDCLTSPSLFASADGQYHVLVTVRPDRLECRSGKEGRVEWSTRVGRLQWASPVINHPPAGVPARVAVGDLTGVLRVIRTDTGTVESKVDLGGSISASPVWADLDGDGVQDLVASTRLPNEKRRTIAFSGRTGQELWRNEKALAWQTALVAGDLDGDGQADVVAPAGEGLMALSGRNGRLLWSAPVGNTTCSIPVLADLDGDGHLDVVVTGIDGTVHALHGIDGKSLWTRKLGGRGLPVVPAYLERGRPPALLVLSGDDHVTALSGKDGHVLSIYHCPSAPYALPLVYDPSKTDRKVINWQDAVVLPPDAPPPPETYRPVYLGVHDGTYLSLTPLPWPLSPPPPPEPVSYSRTRSWNEIHHRR